jgi:mycothiol synthase
VVPPTAVTRVSPADFDRAAFVDDGPAETGRPRPSRALDVATEVRRITDAAAAHDRTSPLDEAALLALRHDGLSRSTLWVATSPASADGQLVGFAWASPEVTSDDRPVEVNLAVDPAFRGQGVGRALARCVLEAAGPGDLSAWSHGNHPGASRLAERFGFERVRDLWVMRRSLVGRADPLPAVEAPSGYVVRQFEPGRDEDAFLQVNAAAFVDHPEQGRMTRGDLEQRMAEPWFDPAGFFLAESAEGELLGYHWTKTHGQGDEAHGEVYVVGVAPAAQGLGLGKVLTLTGLHHLRDRGLSQVILYVEADNAPAVAVYSGLGFTHADADTHVMYRRAGTSRL